jgi:modulator of FtsH protease HflC
MNRNRMIILGIVVIVLGVVANSALFVISQTEQAIVLEFGKPIRVETTPGLKWKIPFVQDARIMEKRVLELDPPVSQLILSDQKRLDVDAYARYRIADPLLYYQAVRNEAGLKARGEDIVTSGMREVLGKVTLLSVLSADREEIMSNIQKSVALAGKRYGIEIIDVRIRRADLPEQAAQAVFARMRSEREREASEARAQGAEKAQEIRASADRERTVLLAEADRDSEILRGEGDRQAIRIYADAYGQDADFYRFYRSMQAYRKALSTADTTMVLSPNSEFFRYFNTTRPKLRPEKDQ